MKKIALAVIIMVCCLSACKPAISEKLPESSASGTEKPFSVEDIDASLYDGVEDKEIVYALIKIGENAPAKCTDENGISYIGEAPKKQVWLLSKNGEPLNDEPFSAFDCVVNQPEWWVVGIRDGVLYSYFVDEGTGAITEEEPFGAEPEEFFGYTVYKYYWDIYNPYYGVTAPDGSEFAEPVYNKILVPFADRIVLFNGNSQIISKSVCTIMNSEKEILSECFNYVNYTVFSDGSYIGTAMCGKDDGDGKLRLYDAAGNPMPEGYWFIDKDGNIISECFAYIPEIVSPSDILSVTDEDGNAVEIKVSDYLCKP